MQTSKKPKRKIRYNVDDNSPIVIKNIADYQDENHHIYYSKQTGYRTTFVRCNRIYRRRFSLLKDAIAYRDECLKISPTPQSRGYAKGGNTKPFHQMFNIYPHDVAVYRVILVTTNGKIRKSFCNIEDARKWRDSEILRRGCMETDKHYPDHIQSYSEISDKSYVFADSDNIRDSLDNIEFGEWEEFAK